MSIVLLDLPIIRPAEQADAKVITTVYIASRSAFVAFAPLVHSHECIYQWVHEVLIPGDLVLVAEKDNVIVGMMALAKEPNMGWVEQLYLAPSAVGCGIGTLLINRAIEALGLPIRLCTFQDNINAQRFYERHGFYIIERRDVSANEERCPDMIYERV